MSTQKDSMKPVAFITFLAAVAGVTSAVPTSDTRIQGEEAVKRLAAADEVSPVKRKPREVRLVNQPLATKGTHMSEDE